MSMQKTQVFALMMLFAATGVSAHPNGWGDRRYDRYAGGQPEQRIRERIERQRNAIDYGVRTGLLTRPELRSADHDHRLIREELRRYRSDGGLSSRELRRVKESLDRAGARLHAFLENDARRYPGRYWRTNDAPRGLPWGTY